MGGAVLILFYGSILFCLVACAIKLFIYARLPVHLRWEIYKAGSIYEYSNWWQKNSIGSSEKLANILKNIIGLKDYYRHNRLFWLALYPFHLGVYLLILWHIWLLVYPSVFTETQPVEYALVWGHTATLLIFLGALGILVLRLTNRTLRASYPRRHYFKWAMILLAAGSGYIAVEYYFNGQMAEVLGYVKYQLEFDIASKLNPPFMTSFHVLTVTAVLVYLPFSHVLRLFFRYYHEWRWSYVPGLSNANSGKEMKNTLEYPVTWTAKHVTTGELWKDLA